MTFGSSQPTAVMGAPSGNGATSVAAGAGGNGSGPPRRGELGIRQRRSWRTWHLVLAVVAALVLGMIIGNDSSSSGGSGATSPNGAAKQTYTPPPPAGSSGTASTSTTVGSSSTTTSAGAGGDTTDTSSTTTTASSTTATTGAPTILLPAKEASGNWTSPAFTVGAAPWSLGWAYQCTPAPAPGSAFQVFVDPVGGPQSTTPAVKGTAASGQSVSPQSVTGQEELSVQAPTGCKWIVKVTGTA
ncbi:MAG TPA: hypothetical protein VMB82_01965 [Acidimicrobiales bacterium]|nr:hypothetical protein [Acidimicrobiales bacterium]